MKLRTLAIAALTALAAPAFATTQTLVFAPAASYAAGVNPQAYDANVVGLPTGGTFFENFFTFSITPMGDAGANGSFTPLSKPRAGGTLFDIRSFTVELFKDGDVDLLVGSVAGNNNPLNSWDFTPGAAYLNGGDYYFRVSGTAAGTMSSTYNFKMDVTPVPEPETYALMIAGLFAVAFLARRRSNQDR